jgi:purine-binding chemotaxis protein CheW
MKNIASSTTEREYDLKSASRFAVFRRCNQFFALSVDIVSEVLHGQPLTRVPRSQNMILGVLSLRGEILPVLTLDDWFGLEAPTNDAELPILVLRQGDLLAGLRVDSIQSVTSIPASEIQPYPAEGEAYFAGIWRSEGTPPITLIASSVLLDALRRTNGTI